MEKHYLTGLTIRHVIMSRGRSDWVTTHKLVPRATLVVREHEVEAYRPLGLEIVPIPPDRIGVSAVRNRIVRRFEEQAVVVYDDDVTACRALAGLANRYISPVEVTTMVENTAYCCARAGASSVPIAGPRRCRAFARACWPTRRPSTRWAGGW